MIHLVLECGQTESLDRGAVHKSNFQQGRAAAVSEREDRRSGEDSLNLHCWAGREYLPDCHKFFCEALSLAVIIRCVNIIMLLFAL